MAFIQITCGCGHCGYTTDRGLHRVLRCYVCHRARLVREANRTIRSQYTNDDFDDGALVPPAPTIEESWARYEGTAKLSPRPRRPKKVRLTPRLA